MEKLFDLYVDDVCMICKRALRYLEAKSVDAASVEGLILN